jgi:hypothetical protein
MKPKMTLAVLPFSGFYETWHNQVIDDTIEQMFSDSATGTHTFDGLVYRVQTTANYRAIFEAYAKDYVESFDLAYPCGITFESLESPREYNFATDRIFVNIPVVEALRIYDEIDEPKLAAHIQERCTSRSGFISNYSNDLEDWGTPDTWDYNQLGVLLHVWVENQTDQEFDQYAEYNLGEVSRDNSVYDDMICRNTPDIDRLFKIHSYLDQRREREGAIA